MSVSEISISNEALSLVSRGAIQSFDERSAEAAACKLLFDNARREVLGDFDWPHVRVVRKATEADVLESTRRGWAHAFTLPGDMIVIWRVSDDPRLSSDPTVTPINYELGASDESLRDDVYIFADSPTVYVRYSSNRIPVGRLPPYLTSLIAVKLAGKLAMPLRRDAKLMQAMNQQYQLFKSAATTQAANLEPDIIQMDFVPELIKVRRT